MMCSLSSRKTDKVSPQSAAVVIIVTREGVKRCDNPGCNIGHINMSHITLLLYTTLYTPPSSPHTPVIPDKMWSAGSDIRSLSHTVASLL